MRADPQSTADVAEQLRRALESADLSAYRELLDPNVTWGPPDDADSGCRGRDEVLAWYRRGRASGARADVTELEVRGDRILVGLHVRTVSEASDPHRESNRWQVLTVVDGRVRDVRGFEDRREALRRLP